MYFRCCTTTHKEEFHVRAIENHEGLTKGSLSKTNYLMQGKKLPKRGAFFIAGKNQGVFCVGVKGNEAVPHAHGVEFESKERRYSVIFRAAKPRG
jgi:hypothetical protein